MTHPLFSLENRVALVTGSSRGLGFAMAEGLAECGATVVVNGRNEKTLAEVAKKLTDRGLRADIAAFDVTDEKAARAGIDAIATSPMSSFPPAPTAGRSCRVGSGRRTSGRSWWRPVGAWLPRATTGGAGLSPCATGCWR